MEAPRRYPAPGAPLPSGFSRPTQLRWSASQAAASAGARRGGEILPPGGSLYTHEAFWRRAIVAGTGESVRRSGPTEEREVRPISGLGEMTRAREGRVGAQCGEEEVVVPLLEENVAPRMGSRLPAVGCCCCLTADDTAGIVKLSKWRGRGQPVGEEEVDASSSFGVSVRRRPSGIAALSPGFSWEPAATPPCRPCGPGAPILCSVFWPYSGWPVPVGPCQPSGQEPGLETSPGRLLTPHAVGEARPLAGGSRRG